MSQTSLAITMISAGLTILWGLYRFGLSLEYRTLQDNMWYLLMLAILPGVTALVGLLFLMGELGCLE